ncbi:hypothetical protein N7449_004722 [Penicillium cf. viridicatum]|uniref:Flavin-containing monooxygenase n=1 Tax=Penicillium cf. viridicatum TaxID=2972119 RepID=A0A9W9MJT9_9EURO|nr:hypothetical protein N7449_004722 [Penicillium cf. viridicatum]
MAIQLVRKLGMRNFEIVEKSTGIGGTWLMNSHPGCGCDVPSHFYSYSFGRMPTGRGSLPYSQRFIGNGCSVTQFVSVMSAGKGKVKKVTQFSRQAHWLSERPNPEYSSTFQFFLRWIPGFQTAYRAYLYFAGFLIESGLGLREDWTKDTAKYIEDNAPGKYRDFLVPKTTIGCKCRVIDISLIT